jgi:hypothetical protein
VSLVPPVAAVVGFAGVPVVTRTFCAVRSERTDNTRMCPSGAANGEAARSADPVDSRPSQ